jgi:hypothetical protein
LAVGVMVTLVSQKGRWIAADFRPAGVYGSTGE